MSENKIYEITQMMQNPRLLESDLNEAAGLVMEMFQRKYVNRLSAAVMEKHVACCDNPPKEVNLLHALKPFMPEENHNQINQAIDALLMAKTFENIQEDIAAVTISASPSSTTSAIQAMDTESYVSASTDASIHEDGIYDIDDKCMFQRQNDGNGLMNILLVMAMQGLF